MYKYIPITMQLSNPVEWRLSHLHYRMLAHKQFVKHHNNAPTCPKKHILKKPNLSTSTVMMEGGGNVLQGHCIRRSFILQLASIIRHIQRRNRYPFHRSHRQRKEGRPFIATRTRGTLKQCQVFYHRAHQDKEEVLMGTRAVFDRGHGCKVRRMNSNNDDAISNAALAKA